MQANSPPAALRAQKSAETRASLIEIARRLFATDGYAATGTEALVAAAGVTRGALYFHFADKAALFDTVLDAVAQEVADVIDAASVNAPSALEALRRGAAAYVDAASDALRRRIYLIDGPSVLGAARWHELENRYSRPRLIEGLRAAGADDAEALAHLFSGAMVEAALWASLDPAVRPRVAAALDRLLASVG